MNLTARIRYMGVCEVHDGDDSPRTRPREGELSTTQGDLARRIDIMGIVQEEWYEKRSLFNAV